MRASGAACTSSTSVCIDVADAMPMAWIALPAADTTLRSCDTLAVSILTECSPRLLRRSYLRAHTISLSLRSRRQRRLQLCAVHRAEVAYRPVKSLSTPSVDE